MPDAALLWPIVTLAVSLYCLARGIVDLRRRSFVWGRWASSPAFSSFRFRCKATP